MEISSCIIIKANIVIGSVKAYRILRNLTHNNSGKAFSKNDSIYISINRQS